MLLTIAGITAVFLPGLTGYGVLCWMMPSKGKINRLFRAFLITVVTYGLGFIGGYVFFLVRDPGPYDDGWHLSGAGIWALLQLAIKIVLGLVSLIRVDGESRKPVAVVELEKDCHKIHELENQSEIGS